MSQRIMLSSSWRYAKAEQHWMSRLNRSSRVVFSTIIVSRESVATGVQIRYTSPTDQVAMFDSRSKSSTHLIRFG